MESDKLFCFKCPIEHSYIKADAPEPVERDILLEAYLEDELRVDPGLLCNIHFILILDISGSMDDKLEADETKLDAVIEAAAHVIDGIKGEDLISIITFTNTEKVFCWAEPTYAKEKLKGRLDEIYDYPRGSTNLAPALKRTHKLLKEMESKNQDTAIKLLILTDGEIHDVEDCVRLAHEFHKKGIDIDTMGIGTDFHGEDMEKLTSGFIEKLENANQTTSVFERSLRTLQNTIATKVRVELDTTEGVEIRGIAKISPDIKLLAHNTKIVSFDNVDRNRRYAAVIRTLIDPAPIGEKAILTCTLCFDIPKKGIMEESIEKVVAVNFTNDPEKYQEAPNAEVLHASTYYTIAIRAQEIQENSDNIDLIMRNLKLIINRLKKIGDMETMARWEAVRDDYIQKGEFSLEEYNKVSVSKSKTSTAYSALPPP
ncbi:MAG TPA: vWA domain-containing protein, partial [Planctomycetota bacterium]|nr:vWA domain-containing protein [Planctomycetota bacterium]